MKKDYIMPLCGLSLVLGFMISQLFMLPDNENTYEKAFKKEQESALAINKRMLDMGVKDWCDTVTAKLEKEYE